MQGKDNQSITIGNVKYDVRECELKQADLRFWAENPRIYSVLNKDGIIPEQSEIEKTMCDTDHVKELKESIRKNGGLMEPIFVRDGDFVVLEGNSRLAAYRILASQDPIRWGMIRAKVLPANIPDSAAFTLIGQYHIVGRKDWSPYEQAGYLYRIMANTGKTEEEVAEELQLKAGDVRRLVKTLAYMNKHSDGDPENWSFYEEISKNRAINRAFFEYDGLEDEIIRQVKAGEIAMAIDVRKLGQIAQANDISSRRILEKIITREETIYTGHKRLEDKGKFDHAYKVCSDFRKRISEDNFCERILREENPKQTRFELSKIQRLVNRLLEKIDKSIDANGEVVIDFDNAAIPDGEHVVDKKTLDKYLKENEGKTIHFRYQSKKRIASGKRWRSSNLVRYTDKYFWCCDEGKDGIAMFSRDRVLEIK